MEGRRAKKGLVVRRRRRRERLYQLHLHPTDRPTTVLHRPAAAPPSSPALRERGSGRRDWNGREGAPEEESKLPRWTFNFRPPHTSRSLLALRLLSICAARTPRKEGGLTPQTNPCKRGGGGDSPVFLEPETKEALLDPSSVLQRRSIPSLWCTATPRPRQASWRASKDDCDCCEERRGEGEKRRGGGGVSCRIKQSMIGS